MAKRVLEQVYHLNLSRAEQHILARIADRCQRGDNEYSTFMSLETICRETGYCRRWVQINLRRLEARGMLIILSKVGGRGHRIYYMIPVDEEGTISPQPPCQNQDQDDFPFLDEHQAPAIAAAIPETPRIIERTLEEQLRYARSIYNKQYKVGAARKDYWREEIEKLEKAIAARDAAIIVDQVRASPAELMSDQVEALVPVSTGQLVALQPGQDLQQIAQMYTGLINLQAGEEEYSKRWQDYQKLILQARDSYNQALTACGAIAPDGRTPIIDDELEQQMQAYARRVYINRERRDGLSVGTNGWNRWNKATLEAVEAFNSILYQLQPQGEYVT